MFFCFRDFALSIAKIQEDWNSDDLQDDEREVAGSSEDFVHPNSDLETKIECGRFEAHTETIPGLTNKNQGNYDEDFFL